MLSRAGCSIDYLFRTGTHSPAAPGLDVFSLFPRVHFYYDVRAMTKQRPFCMYRSVNFALICAYPHAARTYVQSERTHYGTVFLISTVCCSNEPLHNYSLPSPW